MSLRPDGSYRCDRCGADVGNGAVFSAVVVVDLDPDAPGQMRQLHWCRDTCAAVVLNADALADWYATREVTP